jgi:hypothetical protein
VDLTLGQSCDSTPYTALGRHVPAHQVLAGIRNSLAHGNLYIRAGAKIETVVFLSEDRDRTSHELLGYKYVLASPSDLHQLLQNWFSFLETHQIPQAAVALALEEAA